MFDDPIQPFIDRFGVLILDGGLATELEARGHDLSDALWSARLLKDDPDAIRQVHYDYLIAGADCVISASYQATVEGFMRSGLSEVQAEHLLQRSVELAREAREQFWSEEANRTGRLRPLVAASVGPYGAFLADGSEYTGQYGLSEEELFSFHRRRWHTLSESEPDLLVCETIPSAVEARALSRLLAETPEMPAWFSFSCRDGAHISDGTAVVDCVASLARLPQIVAVGINCTAPRYVPSLVSAVRSVTHKPVVVYPNSGEQYDVANKQWTGLSFPQEFAEQSREWRAAGATLLGGCCRTGPHHIRQLHRLHR